VSPSAAENHHGGLPVARGAGLGEGSPLQVYSPDVEAPRCLAPRSTAVGAAAGRDAALACVVMRRRRAYSPISVLCNFAVISFLFSIILK
jgi:hypothetical protein